MAKQIYNYELFTSKKEELMRIQKRRIRKKRARITAAVVIGLALFVGLYISNNSRLYDYVYRNEQDTEERGDVMFEPFRDGFLKYSGDGIEYQKKYGVSEWNMPVSYSHPFIVKSDSYAAMGDRGGNILTIFDESGEVSSLTLGFPLIQAGISRQGMVEVILEGEESNYIQVYDRTGKLIAEMKSTVDVTGYPLTAALSPDGTILVVSYYSVKGMHAKNTIMFYDLSRQLQSEQDISLENGFEYDNLMIPKLVFLKERQMAAVGDGEIHYFKVSDTVRETRAITFSQEIESVLTIDSSIGLLLENEDKPEEGKYIYELYNSSGNRVSRSSVDMNYDKISVWKDQIIALHENECTILNRKGNILFQGDLTGGTLQALFPMSGWRTYRVIFTDKTAEMHMRIWKSGN